VRPHWPGLDRLGRLVRQDVSARLDREHADMHRFTNPRLRHETEVLAVLCVALLLLVFALFVVLK
jgi:hypothetical protein